MLYQLSHYRKKKSQTLLTPICSKEPIAGLEPATHALRMRCSTN